MKPNYYRNRNDHNRPTHQDHPSSSWSEVGKWYSDLIGQKGQYYHEHGIMPGVIRLCRFQPNDSLLDLGCGEGVLARHLPKTVSYVGVDVARNLVETAKIKDRNRAHQYITADCTKKLALIQTQFTHATFILSLQNMEESLFALKNAHQYLAPKGMLIIVINHPCFRIPRQSGWGIAEHNKLQYRWINRYLSPMKIPINIHPGRSNSPFTWTFHQPLSFYSQMLKDTGFFIETIEEWTSDKKSEGSAARMENRSRSEIPLFMAIQAVKK